MPADSQHVHVRSRYPPQRGDRALPAPRSTPCAGFFYRRPARRPTAAEKAASETPADDRQAEKPTSGHRSGRQAAGMSSYRSAVRDFGKEPRKKRESRGLGHRRSPVRLPTTGGLFGPGPATIEPAGEACGPVTGQALGHVPLGCACVCSVCSDGSQKSAASASNKCPIYTRGRLALT